MLHQSGLSVQPLPAQEVAHLLDTSGIASFHSCGAHGPVLLLQLPEDADRHLQDVGFLHLGVWLLVEELWTQERLELLDAAVDSLPAELFHQRLPELQESEQMMSGLCQETTRTHAAANRVLLNPPLTLWARAGCSWGLLRAAWMLGAMAGLWAAEVPAVSV